MARNKANPMPPKSVKAITAAFTGLEKGFFSLMVECLSSKSHMRIVIKQLIQLFPRLHFFEPRFLRSPLFQVAQTILLGLHPRAKTSLRKNHHPVTHSRQFLHGEKGTLPELRHVGQ